MGFLISGFSKTSGDFSVGTEDYKYESEDDKATILTSGYFNGALEGFKIVTGSEIRCKAIDGEFIALMTNIANVITLAEINVGKANQIVTEWKLVDELETLTGPNNPASFILFSRFQVFKFLVGSIYPFQFTFPSNYVDGTPLEFSILYAPETANVGNIQFSLSFKKTTPGNFLDGGIPFFSLFPLQAANGLNIYNNVTFSLGSSFVANEILGLNFSRSKTPVSPYPDPVDVLGFSFKFEVSN